MEKKTFQLLTVSQRNQPLSNDRIVRGRKAQAVTTAKSQDAGKEEPATVVVTEYNCPLRVHLIDGTGYRPLPDRAVRPTYVSGIYTSASNPLEFFDIGPIDETREIAVTCEASNKAMGDWDASVSTSYKGVTPLTRDPLNFVGNTVLKDFVISETLSFGFGTVWEPGFRFKQKTEFFQSGYFGVIQLIRGSYLYQESGSRNWLALKRMPDYVLDTPEGQADPINQRMQIQAGVKQIEFRDAPAVDLGLILTTVPRLSAVQISLQFKTYFMFNPSDSTDPSADRETTWYPLAGLEWECGSKIRWTEQGPRSNRENWKFFSNYHDMMATPTNEFPEWTGRLHAAPVRAPNARTLNVSQP